MLQIGSYVDGKYKVLNKIGQGGMSVVYLALNEKANNDKLNDRFHRIRQIQTMRSEFRIISYFAKITFKIVSWNFLFCEDQSGNILRYGKCFLLIQRLIYNIFCIKSMFQYEL